MSAERMPHERAQWPLISVAPIGLGAWAPIYGGVKARRTLWVLLGVLWSLVAVAGWVMVGISGSKESDVAGLLLTLSWVGGAATSFSIRPAYERQMASPLTAAIESGELRLADRAHAREIARRDPTLAQEIGIGRPDRPGATDAGLVDINNASVSALLSLPGVDDALVTRIVEEREHVGGFSSLEDMGAEMDLGGNLVELLRPRALFLPRSELQ